MYIFVCSNLVVVISLEHLRVSKFISYFLTQLITNGTMSKIERTMFSHQVQTREKHCICISL